MVVENGSSTVILVEPIQKEKERSREEVRAAVRNHGRGFREWASEEAAWGIVQFLKVFVSVATFRGLHQLFRRGFASESVYRRAPDLWAHGHREPPGHVGNGTSYARSNNGFSGTHQTGGNGLDHGPEGMASDKHRYITTVESFRLYLHNRRLHPAQAWPCPVLLATPCRTCSFLEYDASGVPQCAAVWKMKSVIEGVDAGETFEEIREWIRNS